MRVIKSERITLDKPIKLYDVIDAPNHEYQIVTNSGKSIISHNCGIMDECITGDTEIVTSFGTFMIKDLVDKKVQVMTQDELGNITLSSECYIRRIKDSDIIYTIETESGVIRCTGNHRLKLKSGKYKYVRELTEDDELEEVYI